MRTLDATRNFRFSTRSSHSALHEYLRLEPGGIRQLAYEETEHYQITRRFLSDHRAMLAHLLD
jgi:hypothetical protein